MDVFWAAPPVMRSLTAATVLTSVGVYSGLLDFHKIMFYWPWVLAKFPPQLWRFFTSFWLTGPKLGMIFDPYFLYMYGSTLETNSPRFGAKADFAVYLCFVQLIIVALCGGILGGVTFLQPLILAIVHTFASDNPSQKVSLFIMTFDARFLPLAMLCITFVMDGPGGAYQQATGLVAAHLYDFLTRIWPSFGGGRNWLQTPSFVKGWFGEDGSRPAPQARATGTAFPARPAGAPVRSNATGGSTGWASGIANWNNRGQGRRLGGD